MKYNDTTNKNGIVQAIERMTGTTSAVTSAYPLADKTRDVNLALDNYNILASSSSGRWQSSDDTNHSDYPIAYSNLISGVQDYSFKIDEQGNQILDIYKVRIQTSSGEWKTIKQRDFQTQREEIDLETTGEVESYDLTSNGIFLVNIPNYSAVDGIEIWYNRTNSYFTAEDTDKEPGIPNIFHEYLALRPSYIFCLENQLPQASAYRVMLHGQDGKSGMEGAIKDFHSKRNKSERVRLKPRTENCK